MKSADDLKDADRACAIWFDPAKAPAVLDVLRSFPAEGWSTNQATLALGGPVTDEQFRALTRLAGLRPLRVVELWNVELPEPALAHLANLPELHSVAFVHSTKLTELGLQQLARFPKLRSLGLGGARFDPKALTALRESAVYSVSLTGSSSIDDDALEHLAALSMLKHLHLDKTKVTKAGVEKLAKALPQCTIHWDGGTIEPAKKP